MESETVAALLGAVIGGALTILGNLIHESWRDARRAEQLAHAIAGEVSAVLDIAEKRGYLVAIRQFAELARTGTPSILEVHVTHSYFPISEANLDSIGMLPAELPLLIPRFLTLAKSALEDLDTLAQGQWNDLSTEELAERYDELAQIFEEARTAGNALVSVVATMYGSPHGRYPFGVRMRMIRWKVTDLFRWNKQPPPSA